MHFATLNKENLRFLGAILFIFLFGFLIYSNSFHADFFFDDNGGILTNGAVHNVSSFPILWEQYKTRFLAYFSFALNYHFSQEEVLWYHLANWLIHVTTSLGVFILVDLIFKTPLLKNSRSRPAVVALSASLIFLAHPLQTQAVTYIVQRITSLASLFYIGAVIFYLRGRLRGSWRDDVFAVILTILAMFTKEIAFTIPFMLFLCEVILWDSWKPENRKNFVRLIPFGLTLFIIPFFLSQGFLKLGRVAGLTMETDSITRWAYALTELNVLRTYLRLLFIPLNQNVDYDYSITHSLFNGPTIISLLILTAIIILAFKNIFKNRILSFGIFWFFLTLSVESSFIPIRDVIQEHRLYLPMAGFALIVSWGAERFLKNKRIFFLTMASIICVLGFLTCQRNLTWQSKVVLWQDVIKKSPRKSRAYQNLGAIYISEGKYDSAKQLLQQSLALNAHDADAHANLGSLALFENDLESAEEHFHTAIGLDPYAREACNNLGVVYKKRGELTKAREQFLKAIEVDPLSIESRLNLAAVARQERNTPEGLKWYQEVLRINPHYCPAFFYLSEFCFERGEVEEAAGAGKRMLTHCADAAVLTRAGSLFAQNGYSNLAMALFQRALRVNPKYKETYLELGKFFGNQEDFEKAIRVWQEGWGLDNDPRFQDLIVEARKLIGERPVDSVRDR